MAAAAKEARPPIRVCGVPEHFNRPFHLGAEFGTLPDLEWVSIPEGTGRMMAELREGKVDVAVALTEGITASIVNDASHDVCIAGTYVDAPLRWSVVVGAASEYRTLADLKGKPIAVSRMGSGSHLMACLLAEREGWDVDSLEFKVIGNFLALRRAVNEGEAGFFMWEHFTTKPFVDDGELRKVGEIPTPWPCFCFAMRRATLDEEGAAERYKDFFRRVRASCGMMMGTPRQSVGDISARYGLRLGDAKAWFKGVRYSEDGGVERDVLHTTLDALARVGVVTTLGTPEDLVDARITFLRDHRPSTPKTATASVGSDRWAGGAGGAGGGTRGDDSVVEDDFAGADSDDDAADAAGRDRSGSASEESHAYVKAHRAAPSLHSYDEWRTQKDKALGDVMAHLARLQRK